MAADTLFDHPRLSEVLADLVGATERRGTDEYWRSCPLHGGDSTPSFHISAGGKWFCFSCHSGGGALLLLNVALGMDKASAVRLLASRLGVTLDERSPRARAEEVDEEPRPRCSPEADRHARWAEVRETAVRLLNLLRSVAPDRTVRDQLGIRLREQLSNSWTRRQWDAFVGSAEVDDLANLARGYRRTNFHVQIPDLDVSIPAEVSDVLQDCQTWFASRPEVELLARRRGIAVDLAASLGVGYAPADGELLIEHLFDQGHAMSALMAAGVLATGAERGRIASRWRDRLMLPIAWGGQLVGFAGRLMRDDPKAPKYLNSPASPWFQKRAMLYGFQQASETIAHTRRIILVEGYMDVIALQRAGEPAVAVMGDQVTSAQAAFLAHLDAEVVLWLDNDAAGQAGTIASAERLLAVGLWPSVIQLDGVKDADEYDREVTKGRRVSKRALRLAEWTPPGVLERLAPYIDDPFAGPAMAEALGAAKPHTLGPLRLVDRY